MPNRSHLHDYQHKMIHWILDNPKSALYAEMGLGKTIATLTAIADLVQRNQLRRVLVIAPLRVALTTWPHEIECWEHIKHLSYEIIQGTPARRVQKLKSDTHIHIINRELVPWIVDTLRQHWPYDMLVVDEASSFKSPKTKRFKALKIICAETARIVQLTGTPASNGLLDLWSQVFLLDNGKRLERTFNRYKTLYFNSDIYGWHFKPRFGSQKRIYRKLQDICLTLSAADYLQMPKRIENFIEISLPPQVQQQYRSLEADFLLKIEDNTIHVASTAVLTNKLLQFSNGALYTDDTGQFEVMHDLKLDALENIIEEATGQPILVAYSFQSDLKRIMQRFPQAVHIGQAPSTIARWNQGKIPILLAHPASAGYGLNLQSGGHIIVWFGLNYSLELYHQFNARLIRQGQTKPVFVHHLIIKNSIERCVIHALRGKHITQKNLLNALKKDVQNRLYTE